MLVIYNFNESNNQWFLIEISFLVCLRQWLAVSQEKGRLPNTVSSAWEPFVELSSRINFFSQPCYCLWAMICLLSFLIIFSFSMQKMLTTCSKRWWLLIFSMRHEKWVVRSLFAVFSGKMRNICLECSKKKKSQYAVSCVNLWSSARWNVISWGRLYHFSEWGKEGNDYWRVLSNWLCNA